MTRGLAGIAATLLFAVLAAAPAAAAPAGSTLLISRPNGVGPAPAALDNASGAPLAVSADGRYVAFLSSADGFAPGANPRVTNVFLRDTTTGATTLVSRSDGADGAGINSSAASGSEGTVGIAIEPGAQAPDAPHDQPHVLVVFGTDATNLVDHRSGSIPATGGVQQIWLRDVTAATTYLVSRADGAGGVAGDKASRAPSIAQSGHGPLIAFDTLAQNLGATGIANVFMRDLNASQTLLVSCPHRDCASPNPQSAGVALHPSIQFVDGPQATQCPNGQQCALVAFESDDETITGESGAAHGQIVLATALETATSSNAFSKWATVTTAAANTGPAAFGNDESRLPMLGRDGETVVYISAATNLVFPVVAQAGQEAYATIITSGPTGVSGLISGTVASPQGATDVSVGGGAGSLLRFGFTSTSSQLSGPNPFGLPRAYTLLFDGASKPQLLDRGSGTGGAPGDADSSAPAISADGSTAVFDSRSDNLGVGGGSDFARVYSRRLVGDQLELVSRPDGTGAFATGVRESQIEGRAISADGRFVAFESQSDNLAPGENSIVQGVFVRDTLTGTTTLVSRANGAAGAAADTSSTLDGISSDGRRVLFESSASNLGAPSSGSVVYVRDLAANTTTVISRANGVDGTIVQAQGLDISGDGSRVVFLTAATLDPDAPDGIHIYVRDLASNRTIFVDRDNGVRGEPIDGQPIDASIDHDGERVVWTSDERRSVIPTHIVVRLRDLQQNTTALVSRASAPPGDPTAGDPANADAAEPRIDGAGDVIAFRSAATNLGTAVTHQAIWVRNLDTGATQLASRATGAVGDPADADSQTPSLDDAGDRIAFTTTAGNLGSTAPSIFDAHSYVRDLSTDATELVSRDDGPGGLPAAQPGFTVVSLSGNGNCAAFSARSLTLGDGFASADFTSVHMRVLRGECPIAAGSTGGGGGTPTGGGGGSSPPPAPAALGRLAVRPARFRVTGHKRGTTISFRLTRSASVALVFERALIGHRKGKRCVVASKRGKRCSIVKRVGRLTIARAHAGADAVRFIGRLHGKVLAPGRYLLVATPAHGRSRTVNFTVLRAARHLG